MLPLLRKVIVSGILGLAVLIGGCRYSEEPQLLQVATIDSLLAGVYDGSVSVEEWKKFGDFGIGTFDALDGEMAMIDGVVYQIRSDGRVYRPGDNVTMPFASITTFRPTRKITLEEGMDFSALSTAIDRAVSNPNLPVAVRVRGRFRSMHTRSVPAQLKPYRPLAEVTRNQPEFELSEVQGELVGFRLPPYVKGINVPGCHLHFVDAERQYGGHVLGFELEEGGLELMEIYDFRLLLPRNSAAFGDADLSMDRSAELHQVESLQK